MERQFEVISVHCMVCKGVEVIVDRISKNKCMYCESDKIWLMSFLVGDKHKHCLFVFDHKQVDA